LIVAMPTGSAHGWGIAGQHLTEKIYRLMPVEGVTLHCMKNPDFEPTNPEFWNRFNIGYCFFENEIDAYRYMGPAGEKWDHIVAGSKWCEYHLRIGGIEHTSTILQGIDPAHFHQVPPRDDDGRFIVFSGGKFELRKSQDVVIAAMKIFMDHHQDAWLSCAWHNQWPFSIATMSQTSVIDFAMEELPCDELLLKTLARNGIDTSRVIFNPIANNATMLQIYRNSDIGLFPNRCEGGNNMVMCEYMACGRTVIASSRSGHADVITTDIAFPLKEYGQRVIELDDRASAIWFEPSVEEVVEELEYAYQHRDEIAKKATAAAQSMNKLDWQLAAQQFHEIACTFGTPTPNVNESYYLLRGMGLLNIGKLDMAEEQFRLAMAISPLNHEVFSCMEMLCQQAGRDREAELYGNKKQILQMQK